MKQERNLLRRKYSPLKMKVSRNLLKAKRILRKEMVRKISRMQMERRISRRILRKAQIIAMVVALRRNLFQSSQRMIEKMGRIKRLSKTKIRLTGKLREYLEQQQAVMQLKKAKKMVFYSSKSMQRLTEFRIKRHLKRIRLDWLMRLSPNFQEYLNLLCTSVMDLVQCKPVSRMVAKNNAKRSTKYC